MFYSPTSSTEVYKTVRLKRHVGTRVPSIWPLRIEENTYLVHTIFSYFIQYQSIMYLHKTFI